MWHTWRDAVYNNYEMILILVGTILTDVTSGPRVPGTANRGVYSSSTVCSDVPCTPMNRPQNIVGISTWIQAEKYGQFENFKKTTSVL